MPGEKYHISPSTGRPNKCYATKRGCPLGSDTEHYGSKEEARAAYESKMDDQTLTSHSKKSSASPSPQPGGIKRLPKGEKRDYTDQLRQIAARKAAERAAEEAEREAAGEAFASEFSDIFCSNCGKELTGYSDDGLCDDCRRDAEEAEYGGHISLDDLDDQPRRRRTRGGGDMWDDPDDY